MNTDRWINTIMSDMYTSGTRQFWIGLSSTMPNKDGSGVTEPVGGGYSRVRVSSFSAPIDGMIKNEQPLEFPQSTGVWFSSANPARYWVLFDGNYSNSNLLSSGELDEAKTVERNTLITIARETLTITLSDYIPSGA